MRVSAPEVLILTLLMCGSLYIFWLRFRVVVRALRSAKPDKTWGLKPIGPRISRCIWEVLLQGKVIVDRPLAGLAHAFVFWGFCAFALVTVNHLATGYGATLIPPAGSFGTIFFSFVAVFAILVAVSIAALAARRYIARPVWLGEVSPESGLIAFLIFFLMVTYLAGLRLDETTIAGKVNWWLHTLTLLFFLPLIPHTKHLHLLLSPVTIFTRRDGFSKIPPLADDEDFGLDTGKNVTNLVALQAYTCVECGRCTEFCPAFNTGKVLNPKEIILGLRGYLNEFGAGTDEPLLGKHISAEAAFQCTTCGGCEYACPVGIQHLPIIIGLRRGAVNTGKWEDKYGTKLFLALERNGNSLGFPSSERQKFIEKNGLPIFDGSQEYCLWLGCMGAYDPHGREIILALTGVLRHLGVSFGVLRKEKCNGDPIRRLGNDYLLSQLAEPNIEHMKESKVGKLISICPHCVRTIGEDWKEFGAAFTIEHHTEFLARHQERLPSPNGSNERVVYHDPCYLGRYRNVYDEPRQVLGRFATSVDPPRARERSFCCGAGGGQMFLGEEKGKRINMARVEELVGTGAGTVGVACPFCQSMFRDALAAVSTNPPQLMDIVQIAARAIEKSG
ncbi:MAG: [Fe-S]-binding protein [Acidobacteria bacterium]|nr:MAG: [Fe-S]-binding protein [Acidobacteriota bacterium]